MSSRYGKCVYPRFQSNSMTVASRRDRSSDKYTQECSVSIVQHVYARLYIRYLQNYRTFIIQGSLSSRLRLKFIKGETTEKFDSDTNERNSPQVHSDLIRNHLRRPIRTKRPVYYQGPVGQWLAISQ